jgi:hypothetical protein
MIDPSAIHLWTWDARPFPAFPAASDVWGDTGNWDTGHWLTGRLGSAPLDALIETILVDVGITDADCTALKEGVDGYVIDRPMAPRAAIEPLALAYAFDAADVAGVLTFRPRGGEPVAELIEDDLILPGDRAPARLVRAQETELPREVTLSFTDSGTDYRRAAVASRRLVGGAARASHADLAVVTHDAAAERRADIWLQDLWAGREGLSFALPPSRLALASGDVVGVTIGGRRRVVEIRSVTDAEARGIKAQSIDPGVFEVPLAAPRRVPPRPPTPLGPVAAYLLDLPTLTSDEPPILQRIAVFADPWPGPVAVWRSFDGLTFERIALALAPSIVGETLDDLPAGPKSRWDCANRVRVHLYGGALSTATDTQVLNGANAAAVRRPDGAWEVLQFAGAELVDVRTYELSRLLRGQMGSEWAMDAPLAAGAPFILLDRHVLPVARGLESLGRVMQLRIVAADRDHGDPAAAELEAIVQMTALKPLAPVHLSARRTGSGVSLSWFRRKRGPMPASWDVAVPLGEDSEAYELDILSGATVVRTLSSATPTVLYAAADETADFGSAQASLDIRLYQVSATVGRGFAAEATLDL